MFPPVKAALLSALKGVFKDDLYADKVLESTFKANKKFGSRDRRELAEAYYDIIRHYRFLNFRVKPKGAGEALLNDYPLKNMIEDYSEHKDLILGDRKELCDDFATRESIEDSLYKLLCEQLPKDQVQKEIQSMNVQAEVCLRTNQLKIEREALIDELAKEDIEAKADPNSNVALFLAERKNIFRTKAFKSGFFEVQDLGSQKIAPLLQVEPGQRVIDACAGAGGKSLHLAAMMKNKGKVLCLDIHDWKLRELKHRARRSGSSCIEMRLIENNKVIKRLHESADRLLLDVPCTGVGVFRRNPDSKMKWNPDNYKNLLQTQQDILDRYHKMLKPEGKMVYATCSLLPAENEDQVKAFIKRHPEWHIEEEVKLLPSEGPNDGFYAARLSRRA